MIATGTPHGKYFQLGKIIETLLHQKNIPARCIHTNGSIKNLELLHNKTQPTIALMQADVAMAANPGLAHVIYGEKSSANSELEKYEFDHRSIRKIATLHEETLYVLARIEEGQKQPTLRDLFSESEQLTVCVGPEDSGTQLIAMAALETTYDRLKQDSKTELDQFPKTVGLSTADMANQLLSKKIDAAFVVTGKPNQLFTNLLNNPDLSLLSIDANTQTQLLASPAFETEFIAAGTFPCQGDSKGTQTLKTQTVLVAADESNMPFDIGAITSAIYNGRSFLQIDESDPSSMAFKTPMVPLHEDAKQAYTEETDWFPSEQKWGWLDWLTFSGKVLTVVVALLAVLKGALMFRRDSTSNEIGRRIMAIDVDENEPESIEKLNQIRQEIKRRVQQRWWTFGEIDKARWQRNDDLIASRLRVAKEKLALSLVSDVLDLTNTSELDDGDISKRVATLKEKAIQHLHDNQIDGEQMQLIINLLDNIVDPTATHSNANGYDLDKFGKLNQFVGQQNLYLANHQRAKTSVALRKVTEKLNELALGDAFQVLLDKRTIVVSRLT